MKTEKRLRTLRHVALVTFFAALAALEIAHGVFRLETLREENRHRLLEGIEREHVDLAHGLSSLIKERQQHAAYLARAPGALDLSIGPWPRPEARRRFEELVLPYVVSFHGMDRVRVLDAQGRERFRCERMGQGVGALPEALLEAEPDSSLLRLAESLAPGEVRLSEFVVDQARVEVPEESRRVLHYVNRLRSESSAAGILVLTVYAEALLDPIRRFAPLKGVTALLVDGEGRNLAGQGPAMVTELRGAAHSADEAGVLLISRPVSQQPDWRVVARVPHASLDAASEHLGGAYAWIVGSMVSITLVLAVAGAFFLRLSVRELRLREAEREKELERQLHISERLRSLGLLTAGVAHEINNPLEGIGNYLALLEREPLPPESRRRYLSLLRHGFERIRDIVRDLSRFARPDLNQGNADLAEVVRRCLKMVAYSKELKDIEIELEGLDQPLVVAGDAGRLEQVVMNLLLNAGQALRGQGKIRISSERVAGTNGAFELDLIVDDEGPGIPEAILDRIFDPFFTASGGTGLGLSISYGIARAHGGSLTAENRRGGGARFRLRLPAAEDIAQRGLAERRA